MRFAIGETQFTSRNTAQTLEAAPFIESGRTMVPLRAIAEGLDAAAILGWNDGVVYISRGGADFTLAVGVALPDGMGTPVVVAGRVFVPARYVSEIFGATIRWENSTREVFIYEE
ncbi:MAG: copper amine oxidase N-terminal domain-containing protein [Defluviitaleaceae bacterium]|nr:copper amine oxidase N-terminal domain-containing protein [Defluviitaleaceae bacterium]